MPEINVGLQADLAVRMLIAAVLGAAIGLEREIHEHPAGMRTHLLVSLGSAMFTELSIVAFSGPPAPNGSLPTDTSRVAAQIVSGIGFLGAGAILKYGTSIRGLTTAASLWAAAAVGMAAGAGEWLIASVGTFIVLFSLWPLNALVARIHKPGRHDIKLRLEVGRLNALGDVSRLLSDRRVEMAGINTQRIGKGRYEVELDLHLPAAARPQDIIAAITAIPDVELMESTTPGGE
ncbi:MAG: putative Mg2+ transporter-C (MgtC) family protein [Chloroflexota bacterium]|nr:putative Mg2+ transporter-C (MgtC) family protein [Chloroflexota bacterium]